jgi:hypothetical protein
MTDHSPLPHLSAQQSTDLLRAAMTLLADGVASALTKMQQPAIEYLASKLESDLGAPVARRFLGARRDPLARGFTQRVKQEQDEALARLLRKDKSAAASKKISADSLTLMEDDAVATADVVAKVARRMHGPVELALREVDLVASHLSGREQIRSDDNPFAPEVFMKALLETARELGLEPSGWASLLAAFEQPLGEELARGYQRVLDHYRKHRIDAAGIRREAAARQALGRPTLNPITKSPGLGGAGDFTSGFTPITRSPAAQRLAWLDEVPRIDSETPTLFGGAGGGGGGGGGDDSGTGKGGAGGGGGGGGGSAARVVPSASTVAEVRVSLDQLMARMNADLRGTPLPPTVRSPGKPPPDLIEAINEMQRLGASRVAEGERAGPAVGMAGVDQGAWREILLAKSNRTVDKLTIEIVGMLFDHVLQDNQVPAEIKAILSRLQFPVLKVALTDADFFASSTHPARRLIDRLASTAVGWEPYGDENQRYKVEVERIVQQVLERFDKDMGTFDQLLTEFDAFLAEMPARESDPVARAKRALEEAEKREVLQINTTIQVRRAFEHVELEPYLREFLVGPWVQALVSATMRDEQTPGFSKAFRQVIHDVVWSVQPKVSADERKRLVALIPAMTRVLRDGLTMIRMTEQDQQNFLKQLMASHAVAVRPVDQATYIKSKVATGELRSKLDDMHLTGTFPISTGGGVKVSPVAVKRAAESHAAQIVMPEPVAGGSPLSYEQDASYDEQIAAWQRGSWFNLYDGKDVIKVKLRWISPLRTLFMFSTGEDKAARVLSPETIKSYLRQGWLKPLESVPLTKRVVDRMVGELERTPKRAEELANKIGGTTVPRPA